MSDISSEHLDMSEQELDRLWTEVMAAYRPYSLRLESQFLFRNSRDELFAKDDLLADGVCADAELARLIDEATLLAERFRLSLQTAEMKLQDIAWRFCTQFYGLEPNQMIEFGALGEQLQTQRLSVSHDDADPGEL